MEFEIREGKTSPEFPFYDQIDDGKRVIGCVVDADFGCRLCLSKQFCKCKSIKEELAWPVSGK